MRLSDADLKGRTVVSSDGQVVGEVDALFVDSVGWRIESVRVRLRKEIADQLGASRSMFHPGTLEVPTTMVQGVSDAVVLTVKTHDLRRVVAPDTSSQELTQ